MTATTGTDGVHRKSRTTPARVSVGLAAGLVVAGWLLVSTPFALPVWLVAAALLLVACALDPSPRAMGLGVILVVALFLTFPLIGNGAIYLAGLGPDSGGAQAARTVTPH